MTVYTETVVHLAGPDFQSAAPYQVAIVTRDDGTRSTGRIEGEHVEIGDTVVETELIGGVPWFRKA